MLAIKAVSYTHLTNKAHYKGNLAGAAKGADVLIGVSGPRLFTKDIMESMAPKAVVFALANPVPETTYEEALSLIHI